MAANANKRVFYAVQKVGLMEDGGSSFTQLHGVQSVAVNTNFNLDQVFELGQIAIYENREDVPDVEVTMTKVLDGWSPIYLQATKGLGASIPANPTLAARSNTKTIFGLAIYKDTETQASGTPISELQCSGMFINTISYNFPLDESFTEEVTLVGNHKVWARDTNIVQGAPAPSFAGGFGNDDIPIGAGGVNRRENLQFTPSDTTSVDSNGQLKAPDATILPPVIFGISANGRNLESAANEFDAHLNSITVSVDLGREQINELGRKLPYHRFVTFPTEVTCEVQVTTTSGDMVSATEEGILTPGAAGACDDSGNLKHGTIRIVTCEGTRIYLGQKNKLASVNYGGGDAGGGNVNVTYSFTTFNDFTVMHSGDPNRGVSSAFNYNASGSGYLFSSSLA